MHFESSLTALLRSGWEEGGEVEHNQLMHWAVKKFKGCKEADTWCQKSTEEETLIVLQAQIKDLIAKNYKWGKQDTAKENSSRSKNVKKAKRLAKNPTLRENPLKDKEKESKQISLVFNSQGMNSPQTKWMQRSCINRQGDNSVPRCQLERG